MIYKIYYHVCPLSVIKGVFLRLHEPVQCGYKRSLLELLKKSKKITDKFSFLILLWRHEKTNLINKQ